MTNSPVITVTSNPCDLLQELRSNNVTFDPKIADLSSLVIKPHPYSVSPFHSIYQVVYGAVDWESVAVVGED